LHDVPIGLGVIGHEALEVWIRNTFLQHHLVQLSSKDTLNICVFKLFQTLMSSNCFEHLCFHIACHKRKLSSFYNKLDHTHGKQGSSNPRHISHD
jgi:hypothetical protein